MLTSLPHDQAWGSFILSAFSTLEEIGGQVFGQETVAPFIHATNLTYSLPVLRVILSPIGTTFLNLTPYAFGSRIMVNTAAMVLPVRPPFFRKPETKHSCRDCPQIVSQFMVRSSLSGPSTKP